MVWLKPADMAVTPAQADEHTSSRIARHCVARQIPRIFFAPLQAGTQSPALVEGYPVPGGQITPAFAISRMVVGALISTAVGGLTPLPSCVTI